MSSRPPSYSNPDPRAVGIIGLSISSPGGEAHAHGLDSEAFYEFLKHRGSGIITVPANRWNAQAFYGNSPGKISTTAGGFIPDFSYADLQEFGIPPAEASQMAFSQHALLHQAFNALQRSGVDNRGSKTGVYVGCAGGLPPNEGDITQTGAYFMTGTSLSMTSNRINYVFDLLGPSMTVDTACSSSLTAMHLAFQAIRDGECDQAVVAGVNFVVNPIESSSFSRLGVLSPDGISKAFDDEANGYARADVASAVVIKRHDLAVRDNDRIHATLVGSALTSCGSIMGSVTTPNPEAQSQAIRNAYCDAGLTPNQADFVELHGTGTTVGDPLEANTAGALFAEGRNGREIIIGSVKSNVGHGKMGAYMSSLVKVVLMLERKEILPNGYFNTPSTKIAFQKYNLRVPIEVEDMVAYNADQGLIASISSYGFGGTCGHTVLRGHEVRPTQPDADTLQKGPFLFAIGALSPKALHSLVRSYKEECVASPPLVLCDHLGGRARQMPWRTYAIADSLEAATFYEPVMVEKRPNPLIYCFSGQGPQHWQQGRGLMAVYPTFRKSIYACDRVHKEYTGRSFLEDTGLFVDEAPKSFPLAENIKWPADTISVAIAFFQIALFDLISSLGVKPDAIIGHSIGETTVLYASSAMPRDMVVKIAVARGRALALVDNTGGSMVAISGCEADTVREYIDAASSLAPTSEPESKRLYIAAFNSPTDTAVSGSDLLVDILVKYINNWVDGVVAKKIRVSTAVHSPFVDPCEDSYRSELTTIFSQHTGPFIPSTLTMSTVTAKFKYDEYTIDYLWSNLRQPVLFSSAVPKVIHRFGEKTSFLEFSPHPILSKYIKHMGASDSLPCSKRPLSAQHLKPNTKPITEVHTFLQAVGQLLTCGINSINFSFLNGCPSGSFVSPAYPFQMKFWPFMAREASSLAYLLPATRPLNSSRLRISPDLPEPWVSHHIIDHSILLPAAAYIEMALEFPGVTQVWDCHFETLFIVEESGPPSTLEVAKDGIDWTVKSSSALESMQGDLEWTRSAPQFDVMHAHGKVGYGKPKLSSSSVTEVDVDAILARCTETHVKDELYAAVEDFVQFGPEFMRVNKASVNDLEAILWLRGPVGLNTTDYIFHPALMDAVFQTTIGWSILYEQMTSRNHRPFLLPHSLRRGYRNDGSSGPLMLPDEFRAYTIRTDWSPYHCSIDAYVLDENNKVLFTFEGLRFEAVTQDNQWPTERYMTYWQPRALPQTAFHGTVVLEGPSRKSETTELLHLLDQMALKYTAETLKALPERFKTELSSDRKRYLAWAQELSLKHGVPAAPEITPAIEERYPSLLEVTKRIGTRQQDIMLKSTVAVEVLFCDDLMSKIYDHPPFVGPIFDQTVAKFIELVENAISAGKRVIRVLEVGAGTGRFTALLGQALLDAKLGEECYVDYICSDISISLAMESTAKSPWPTMTPMTFNLNVPLEEQSLDAASFDLVVAFDVLHATSSIRDSLATLHDLLLPGGHLAIIELDGSSFASDAVGTIWMDFVFGSFAEWMGVLDNRPGSTHCSLPPAEWESALDAAGYVDTLLMTSSGGSVAHLAFISQNPPSLVAGRRDPSSPASSSSSLYESYIHGSAIRPNTSIKHDSNAALAGDVEDPLFSRPHEILANGLNDSLIIVRSFSAGGEVDLVQFLSGLDSMKPHIVWLHTGTEESNSTLIGLVRSIRHEFTLWKIMMVLFHPSWDECRQRLFIYENLMSLKWVDSDVLVDEGGGMSVPRIIAAPALPLTEAREDKPVEFDQSLIWRAFPAPLGPEDVEITVAFLSLSSAFAGCSEFSGQVTAVGSNASSRSLVGKRVFGIDSSKQGNVIVCHRSQVALIPSGMHPSAAAATVGRFCFISSVVNKALIAAAVKNPRVLLHAGNCSPAAIATYTYLKANSFDVMITVNDITNLRCVVDPSHLPVHISGRCHEWSFWAREWAKKGVDLAFNFDNDPSVTKETIKTLSTRGTLVQIGRGHDFPWQIRCGQSSISIDYQHILDDQDIVQSALTVVPPATRALFTPPVELFELGQLSAAQARSQEPSITDTAVLLDLQVIDSSLPIMRGGAIRGTSVFNPRASYVVIGGVGGLGASIAQCLIENGARHVVLTSRSGEDAFKSGRLNRERMIVKYLRSIPGVSIDVLAVDCLDVKKTKKVFENSSRRVAGVFYLPVRLNDQLFINLTAPEDWQNVYAVKVKGLKVLLEAVDPRSLDFLVLTSSLATVTGSPGQSNYTASQTEMEAIGASLPNTVSVTVPPISDGGVFMRGMNFGNTRNAALAKYKSLGMPGTLVAEHCVNAIWTLNTTAANPTYIPPMNWKTAVAQIGIPPYYLAPLRHLLAKENAGASLSNTSVKQTIHGACANVLALNVEDVETDVSLSSYGLDSLTSVRLSGILNQHFDTIVTQIQLLSSHITVEKLEAMQDEQRLASASSAQASTSGKSEDDAIGQASLESDIEKTVVHLNAVTTGRPIFILHGAGGGILVMQKIAQKINHPVYGVQDTSEAPITGTLDQLSRFYLSKIKERQPLGPYRLGGFSFGTALAFTIAQILQAESATVEVLMMLEGAPSLFHRPMFRDYTQAGIREGKFREHILEVIYDISTSGCLDKVDDDLSRDFVDHFQKIDAGSSGSNWVARFCKTFAAHVLMGFRASIDAKKREEEGTLRDEVWPSQRVVLVRADEGVASQPYAQGASRFFDLDKWVSDVELHEVHGSHFGIFNPDSGLAEIINVVLA